jgi:8-oxo-dGTP diphosphatase
MNTNYSGYEQPAVTVDLVLLTVRNNALEVMLARRADEPFAGDWSIPGGFLKAGESLEQAALRVLKEKTGVEDAYLEQLYTFGEPYRDPRGRVITVTYIALIPSQHLNRPPTERIAELTWVPVHRLPRLAFDHEEIIRYAVQRLRAKAGYSNIVYGLMPERFRLSELQEMYEIILNDRLDKRNFRKRMLATGLLQSTGRKVASGAHRPAMLYKFKKKEIAFLD